MTDLLGKDLRGGDNVNTSPLQPRVEQPLCEMQVPSSAWCSARFSHCLPERRHSRKRGTVGFAMVARASSFSFTRVGHQHGGLNLGSIWPILRHGVLPIACSLQAIWGGQTFFFRVCTTNSSATLSLAADHGVTPFLLVVSCLSPRFGTRSEHR